MSIIVFAENKSGKILKSSFEAVSYAKKMDDEVIVVTYGTIEGDGGLGNFGASKVLIASNITFIDSQQMTNLVVNAAKDNNSNTIIFSHDDTGKMIAPRVAIKLNAGLVAGAIGLPSGDTIKKNVFSGKAFANVKVDGDKKVITLTSNSITVEETGGIAEVIAYNPDSGSTGVVLKELKTTDSGGHIPLPEAEKVVSAGRGLKGPENWGMIEELAELIGAATACSRPVGDIGWRPHHEHVSQTGLAIRPNLYIAVGISGAIQHLAGVNGSKVIVVINTDSEAPFFKAADYGIVGDAFDVVPKLITAIKNLG